MMTRELQSYYENRFETFSTKGWKDLIEDVDGMIASTSSIDGMETIEQLHFRKGELSILRWLKTLPDVSLEVFEQLKEDKDAV